MRLEQLPSTLAQRDLVSRRKWTLAVKFLNKCGFGPPRSLGLAELVRSVVTAVVGWLSDGLPGRQDFWPAVRTRTACPRSSAAERDGPAQFFCPLQATAGTSLSARQTFRAATQHNFGPPYFPSSMDWRDDCPAFDIERPAPVGWWDGVVARAMCHVHLADCERLAIFPHFPGEMLWRDHTTTTTNIFDIIPTENRNSLLSRTRGLSSVVVGVLDHGPRLW